MSTKDQEPGFASRWSRLKQEAREERPEEAPPAEADVPVSPEGPQEDTRTDAEVLEELGLPDPDTLKPGDDIKGFMAKAVPVRLRNRALRKLWLSNPVLANLDELVEYGEDYTDAAAVIDNLQTAYQVGKGWTDKVVETPKPPPRDETAEPGADSVAEEKAEAELATDQDAADPPPADEADTAERETPAPEAQAVSTDMPQPISRKRMRFRVAED